MTDTSNLADILASLETIKWLLALLILAVFINGLGK